MKYTSAYLTGGSSALAVAATWAALTNTGKFSITIDGTARENITPDFTGDTTMADVAESIQAAVRTATSALETVTWVTDHFVIASVNRTYASAITACSAPGSGVDLSAAAYMDCAGNATVTRVSALAGMDVEDIYGDVAAEVFGDRTDTSLDADVFRTWLNDGYHEVMNRIDAIDPNFSIANSTTFDITGDISASEQTFSLETYAPHCETILRVDYVDDGAADADFTTPIEETEYDEKLPKTRLRWCRQGSSIIFRGLYDDIDNVTIRYRTRREFLIADSDIPVFDAGYHSVLVDYVIFRYYKQQNLETDWRPFKGNFDLRVQELVDRHTPADEPINMQPEYDDGNPDWLGFEHQRSFYRR